MRLNIKKIVIICCILMFIWLFASYSSLIEVPKPQYVRYSAAELQNKIVELEKKMENQLADSSKLLEKLKKKIKKADVKDDKNSEKEVLDPSNLVLPVLIIACDRVTVKRCLDNLIKFRPSKETFPIIVSQDCGHNATFQVIKSFVDADSSITVVRQPDLSEIPLPRAKVKFRGYYKIARHYKFALNYVLKELGHEAVIIVEDDLDISPDFFEYFLGTYPLLYKDPSLWCVSAWNDNGKKEVIDLAHPELLHRTDFFPGLGWLLRANTWSKLEPQWPLAFFDDWLRNPDNVEHKACIRPEISRTYSFGKVGVSKGLFFDMHLRNIQLNLDFVEFTKLNLSYLLKDNYDANLTATVYSQPEMSASEALSLGDSAPRTVRVSYSNAQSYRKNAKKLGLMDDFRSGVPRTAYRGIVTCYIRGHRVYLAPDYNWTRYDASWG